MLDLTLKFKSLNHVKCMTHRGETSSVLGRGEIKTSFLICIQVSQFGNLYMSEYDLQIFSGERIFDQFFKHIMIVFGLFFFRSTKQCSGSQALLWALFRQVQ